MLSYKHFAIFIICILIISTTLILMFPSNTHKPFLITGTFFSIQKTDLTTIEKPKTESKEKTETPNKEEIINSNKNKTISSNKKINKRNYNDEKILLCPTFEEEENDPTNPKFKNAPCLVSATLFSQKDINYAITFFKKIKYSIINNDIEFFANTISYPLTIIEYNDDLGIQKRKYTIKNKEELLKLDKNYLFKDTLKEDNYLFWNWKGFWWGNFQVYIENQKIHDLMIFITLN